jgi:hypothetical protein
MPSIVNLTPFSCISLALCHSATTLGCWCNGKIVRKVRIMVKII